LPAPAKATVVPNGIGTMLHANPSAMPGHVSRSGNHRCSASNAARAINSQQKIIRPIDLVSPNDRGVCGRLGAKSRKRHAIRAQVPATAISTITYLHPIHAPQDRHRPRSASQLTSGTFSHHARVLPQLRQCERGLTMLSPAGQRVRHTFRKLPKASPMSAANTVPRT